MHEHRVVHGLDQTLKQLFAILQPRAALLEIFQQFIDRGAELAQRAGLASSAMRPAAPPASMRCQIWLRELVDRALLAPLPHKEHDHAHRQNGRGQEPQTKEDKINADLDNDES